MKRALRGVFAIATGDAVVRGVNFFITAFLARALGPSEFGLMTIGLSVLAYLSQFSGAGLQVLETRNVATGKSNARVATILPLRFSLAVLLVAIAGGVLFFLDLPDDTRRVLWFSTLLLLPLAMSLEWFFQGKERFVLLAVSRILTVSVYGLFVLILVDGPEDVASAVLAFGAGTLAGSLLLLFLLPEGFGGVRLNLDPTEWSKILKNSMPVTLSLIFAQSAVNLGPIALGYFSGTDSAGVFSAAIKLVIVVLIADRILSSLFLPYISRIYGSRVDDFASVVTLVFKGTFTVIVPVAGCCFILAPWVIPVVFGDAYYESVISFRILLFYVVFTLLNSVLMCSMLAAGEEARYSKILLAGSAVLASLVIIGSAMFGPIGAALGVGLGEMILFLLLVSTARSVLQINLSSPVLRYSIALGTMAASFALTSSWDPVVVILISIPVFVISVVLLGGTTPAELRSLWGRFI